MEEGADVADEEVRCFQGGKVAAAVELRPMHDSVRLLGKASDSDIRGEPGLLR